MYFFVSVYLSIVFKKCYVSYCLMLLMYLPITIPFQLPESSASCWKELLRRCMPILVIIAFCVVINT